MGCLMRKNSLFVVLFLLCAAIAASAQLVSKPFRYDPQRVAIGTVYHYVKTNVDGTQPENISLFVASRDRIESFKFHEKGTRAGLVTADIDWKNFIAKKLESWQVSGKDDRKLFATLTYKPAEKAVEVSIPAMKPEPEFAKIERLPFHLYNFDLASLNVSLPHLADPKGSFTVGIADPTFKPDGPMFAYKGDMNVSFAATEMHNGVKCRRYSASGSGIGGKGTIWVDDTLGHIVEMEFDVANNPDWKTFKLKLLRTEKMTGDGWQRFIADHFSSGSK